MLFTAFVGFVYLPAVMTVKGFTASVLQSAGVHTCTPFNKRKGALRAIYMYTSRVFTGVLCWKAMLFTGFVAFVHVCAVMSVRGFTVGVLQSAGVRTITSVKGRKGFTGYIYGTRAGF